LARPFFIANDVLFAAASASTVGAGAAGVGAVAIAVTPPNN